MVSQDRTESMEQKRDPSFRDLLMESDFGDAEKTHITYGDNVGLSQR